MKYILAILVSVCGFASGQSGLYNVPYKPQPRILIPHVEAPLVVVGTNGNITANPYRTLKYCDFVIKAIDQTGADFDGAPLRYVYSSSQFLTHPGYDANAKVFFQKSDLPWPEKVLRRSNFVIGDEANPFDVPAVIYLGQFTFRKATIQDLINWGGFVANLDTNYPVYFSGTPGQAPGHIYGKIIGSGFWGDVYRNPGLSNTVTLAANPNWGDTNFCASSHYDPLMVSTVQTASENNAAAIEVYPSTRASWMFQGNPNVKWMCLLSNGIDFYRDPQSGEPMWFNVDVEWVDRVPEAGVWSN